MKLYKDFVIKTPKRIQFKDTKALDRIAEAQTYLASKVDGVLPCYRVGLQLFMPRAPGVDAGKVMKKWPHIKKKRDQVVEAIKRHGYLLTDVGSKNVIYDEENDKVYLIDFHQVKKVGD